MESPFLLAFAKKCISPSRVVGLSERYFYDYDADMIRQKETCLFAIDLEEDGPKTKKGDLESGDDNKDKRMWL